MRYLGVIRYRLHFPSQSKLKFRTNENTDRKINCHNVCQLPPLIILDQYFRNSCKGIINNLNVLYDYMCTEAYMVNAWNQFLNHEFGKSELESLKEKNYCCSPAIGKSGLAFGGEPTVANGVESLLPIALIQQTLIADLTELGNVWRCLV